MGSDKRVLGAGNPKTLDIPRLLEQAKASSNATTGVLDNSLFTDDDF
jgi:hypothetical protein